MVVRNGAFAARVKECCALHPQKSVLCISRTSNARESDFFFFFQETSLWVRMEFLPCSLLVEGVMWPIVCES